MINSVLLSIVVYVYGIAGFLYIFSYVFKRESSVRIAIWVSIFGFTVNTIGIMIRWIESYKLGIGHAPIYFQYEYLILFSWAAVLIFFLVESKYKSRLMGAFIMPMAFLAMAYASFSPNISDHIQPLIPSLKSNWLFAHVSTCLIAYATLSIAFSINVMYLLSPRERGNGKPFLHRIPKASILDELAHQLLAFGVIFLLAGVFTGAVWAKSAWGVYWSWDPKETWSLITCCLYLNTLFVRYFIRRRGWETIIRKLIGILITVLMLGALLFAPIPLIILFVFYLIIFFLMKKLGFHRQTISAVLSIIAFVALLFTWFGVNLLPGLHSFQ
jgi:cytochrome c-type biogenesis protein CcsB